MAKSGKKRLGLIVQQDKEISCVAQLTGKSSKERRRRLYEACCLGVTACMTQLHHSANEPNFKENRQPFWSVQALFDLSL